MAQCIEEAKEMIYPPASPSRSGVPAGGSAGQALVKNSDASWDVSWKTISGDGSAITVDDELSSTSTNPVQNKVIKEAIDNIVAGGVIVDDALSTTSEYPVQNKVITAALALKQDVMSAGDGIDITNNVISLGINPVPLVDVQGWFA